MNNSQYRYLGIGLVFIGGFLGCAVGDILYPSVHGLYDYPKYLGAALGAMTGVTAYLFCIQQSKEQ